MEKKTPKGTGRRGGDDDDLQGSFDLLEKALPSIDRTPSPNRIRSSELTESGESNKVGRPAQLPPAGVPTPKKSLVFSPDSDTGAGAATAKSDTSEEGSPIAQKFNLGSPLPSGATLTTRERKKPNADKKRVAGSKDPPAKETKKKSSPAEGSQTPSGDEEKSKKAKRKSSDKKQKRAKRACYWCNHSNQTCDDEWPCTNCIKLDYPEMCVSIEEGKQNNFKARIGTWPCKLNKDCSKKFKHGARCKTGRKAKRSPAKKKDPEDKKKA